jgi:transposase InsO family protein
VNHKKIQRLWRKEGLRVPQRRRRKRVGSSTAPDWPTADAPNRVWAVDFQFDATTDGRPIKLVSIIDEHTRECLTSLVERSVTADALIDELDRLALTRGYPAVLRCDNGPELACEAMADGAGEHVALSFIPPGEPWRNGYVESFNGRVRDECLHCTGKAHRREHLGYAGRRVLVSRKWSGKTLADHRGDRKAWLLATLGLPADDPCQYHWERVNSGDRDHMPPGRRLLHVLTDRAR